MITNEQSAAYVRHAYEVAAQIAEQHAACEGRHACATPSGMEAWKTCSQLIAEGIRNTQGSRNPGPLCGREWRSNDGVSRFFVCPRRHAHEGRCGDNTNKRRMDDCYEVCRECHGSGQWRDGSACESCKGTGRAN